MSDDRLMEELKAARAPAKAAPERIIEAAKAAFIWRGIDEELELLTLAYDSSLAESSGVRGPETSSERILVFESEEVTMTLEVGAQVLMGQVVPARLERVILESPSGQVDEAESDDSGFFLLRRPAAGPLRLKWEDHGANVVTEWVPI